MADMETRVERIPLPIPPKLVVTTADGSTEFALGSPELTFGRDEDNDIVVMADAVSRHHAALELRDDGVLIRDLDSTNGIAVDSTLVPEALLGPGGEVTIGTSVTLTYLPPQSVADQLAAMLSVPAAEPVEVAAFVEEPAAEVVAVVEEEPAAEVVVVVEEEPAAEPVVVAVEEPAAEPVVVAVEEPAPFLRPAGPAPEEPAVAPEEPAVAPEEQRPGQGWYLSCSGSDSQIGPCAWSDLLALGHDGAIHTGDFVWHESLVDWLPVEQLPELAPHLRHEAEGTEVAVVGEAPAAEALGAADAPAFEVAAVAEAPAFEVAAVAEAPAAEPLGATQIAEPWAPPLAAVAAAAPAAEESAPAATAATPGPTDMTVGWYMSRGEGASAWQGGPYTWEELVGYARERRLEAGDFVWHDGYAGWVSPSEVPGLLPAAGASW